MEWNTSLIQIFLFYNQAYDNVFLEKHHIGLFSRQLLHVYFQMSDRIRRSSVRNPQPRMATGTQYGWYASAAVIRPGHGVKL